MTSPRLRVLAVACTPLMVAVMTTSSIDAGAGDARRDRAGGMRLGLVSAGYIPHAQRECVNDGATTDDSSRARVEKDPGRYAVSTGGTYTAHEPGNPDEVVELTATSRAAERHTRSASPRSRLSGSAELVLTQPDDYRGDCDANPSASFTVSTTFKVHEAGRIIVTADISGVWAELVLRTDRPRFDEYLGYSEPPPDRARFEVPVPAKGGKVEVSGWSRCQVHSHGFDSVDTCSTSIDASIRFEPRS